MEAIIEQEKQSYYLSLRQTQTTLNLAQTKLTQMPELAQNILEIVRSRGRINMGG